MECWFSMTLPLGVALVVFIFSYYAYRHEDINRLMTAIAERTAFLTHEFAKLYNGWAVQIDPRLTPG